MQPHHGALDAHGGMVDHPRLREWRKIERKRIDKGRSMIISKNHLTFVRGNIVRIRMVEIRWIYVAWNSLTLNEISIHTTFICWLILWHTRFSWIIGWRWTGRKDLRWDQAELQLINSIGSGSSSVKGSSTDFHLKKNKDEKRSDDKAGRSCLAMVDLASSHTTNISLFICVRKIRKEIRLTRWIST